MKLKKFHFFVFPNKMKIEIQEEGKEKQIFFTFRDATQATGIASSTIAKYIKNKKSNRFTRQLDRKVFIIQEEKEEPFIQVDGENFFH